MSYEISPEKMERFRGVVTNFLSRKGYGFIDSESGERLFVHYSDIRGKAYRTLIAGEEVEFSRVQGRKGMQAVDVERLNPPEVEDLPPLSDLDRTW